MEFKRSIATFLIINITFLIGIVLNVVILTLLGVEELNILATFNILIIMLIVDVTFFIFSKIQKNKEIEQRKFITDTIHSIRTPLTVINASADLLSLEQTNEYIEQIKDEVEKIERLSSDLMNYSIIRENLYLKQTNFNLSELIKDECYSASIVAKNLNKSLNVIVTEEIILNSNKERISTVIATLLDNACKYSISEIECELTKEYLSITNDTSLDDGNYLFLFERFNRNENDVAGYGLGLSIVKLICDIYKYKITAQVVNKKMTIKITI